LVDDRSSLALRARTGSDLVALFADLPTTVVPASMIPAGPAGPVPADLGGGRAGALPIGRVVIACVIAAIVLGNVAGGLGQHSFGWLVPVVVLGCVFLRLRHR
jgi:hypothetical protein